MEPSTPDAEDKETRLPEEDAEISSLLCGEEKAADENEDSTLFEEDNVAKMLLLSKEEVANEGGIPALLDEDDGARLLLRPGIDEKMAEGFEVLVGDMRVEIEDEPAVENLISGSVEGTLLEY